jgi:8-oxo-dGTP pyrophosphatase MutT (NUDIX family)
MDKPVFKNKPNEHIIIRHEFKNTINTIDYWISRAVAVVGIVFVIPLVGGIQTLITRRTMEMPDEAGKFGLPCGYLDFDETGYDAMVREVYEETSLYLPKYKKYLVLNNNEQPFTVHDKPSRDSRQNVSLIYLSVYDFHEAMDQFPLDILKYTDKETSEVKWMLLTDFYCKFDREYEWAFKHNETIKEALIFFNNK